MTNNVTPVTPVIRFPSHVRWELLTTDIEAHFEELKRLSSTPGLLDANRPEMGVRFPCLGVDRVSLSQTFMTKYRKKSFVSGGVAVDITGGDGMVLSHPSSSVHALKELNRRSRSSSNYVLSFSGKELSPQFLNGLNLLVAVEILVRAEDFSFRTMLLDSVVTLANGLVLVVVNPMVARCWNSKEGNNGLFM